MAKHSLTLPWLNLSKFDNIKKYRFQGPGKLLVDFWAAVEKFTGIEEWQLCVNP